MWNEMHWIGLSISCGSPVLLWRYGLYYTMWVVLLNKSSVRGFCYLLLLLISCAARNISATRIFASAEWGETAERNFKWAAVLSRQRRWCSDSYHKQSDLFKCSSARPSAGLEVKAANPSVANQISNPCFWQGLVTSRCHGNLDGNAGCYVVSWVTSSARDGKTSFLFPHKCQSVKMSSAAVAGERWWTSRTREQSHSYVI